MAYQKLDADPWGSVKGLVVGNIFQIGDRIGAGAYGKVFNATCIPTGENVAVKMESKRKHNYLELESKILFDLSNSKLGFPTWRWYGSEGGYNVLVMDKLGSNLSSLLMSCNENFSLKTTLMLADQCILRLQSLHECGFVHSDIKPENFVMGAGEGVSNMLFLIDFGLSKSYRNRFTHHHIPEKNGVSFNGTVRYASINTHQGVECSRRDDLESLGYMLIQFLKRRLPWSGLVLNANETLFKKVLKVKLDNPVEKLCSGLPKCFHEYLRYCRGLEFKETPDYNHLRAIFQAEMQFQNYFYDCQYDWVKTAVPRTTHFPTTVGPISSNGLAVPMMNGNYYPLPQTYHYHYYPACGY